MAVLPGGRLLAVAVVSWLALAPAALSAAEVPTALRLAAGGPAPEPVTPAAGVDADLPPPVLYDAALLPEPVRRLRATLMELARAGELEALRPVIAANPEAPIFTFGDQGDPIDTLRSLSGDAEGREILAILLEVLESGFVRLDPDTPDEIFVWPYFYAWPIERLTGPQMVELFRLITAGDYAAMRDFGQYLFYRVGIAGDGTWLFFVAGD